MAFLGAAIKLAALQEDHTTLLKNSAFLINHPCN
jgi:hypothetical protein